MAESSLKSPAPLTEGPRLLVMLNYGAKLSEWRRIGLADRELHYYRVMQHEGLGDVGCVTYDTNVAEHATYAAPLVLYGKPMSWGDARHSVCAPWLHARAFRHAEIIKTNQSHGAWMGALAKLRWPRKRFVIRCGYVRTAQIMGGDEGRGIWSARWARWVEWVCFRLADAAVVTTPDDRNLLVSRYGVPIIKIHIIPNSVDTSQFHPPTEPRSWARPLRVVIVGRLVPLKNVEGAIEALATLRETANLTVIGEGHRRTALETLARERGVKARFVGSVNNDALPGYLRQSDVLLLTQWYGAGMSKVMIEAMACGVIVVASDIEAHRQVVKDGVDGVICGPEPAALAAGLRRVFAGGPEWLAALSRRALASVEANYTMRAVACRELALYRELIARSEGNCGKV